MNEDNRKLMEQKITEALRENFRPEFLNRIDEVVVFNNLSKEQIIEIANIQINILKKRLKTKKIDLVVSGDAKGFLAEKGYDSHYGARPLKRTIQRFIQDPLALLVLENKFKEGDRIEADLDRGNGSIHFKKI
jgi:ATP-dependent Clp protease ATP-binding subunit ClpB